jgi:hypothetical protein
MLEFAAGRRRQHVGNHSLLRTMLECFRVLGGHALQERQLQSQYVGVRIVCVVIHLHVPPML